MMFLAIFLAPFKASSVFNFTLGGSPTGLQAGSFGAILLLAKLAFDAVLRGRLAVSTTVIRNLMPLFAFVSFSMISALVLTFVFRGYVQVYPLTTGLSADDLRTLGFNSGHFTQTVYLVVNALFAWAIANTVATQGLQWQASRAYALTTTFIVIMGLYQLVAYYGGLPYPYEVINNNPGYTQNYFQQVLDVKRFSSVFTEPSAAAHWLSGFIPFAFVAWLKGLHGRWIMYLGVACLGCLIVATSATGYAVLGIFVAWLAWKSITWLSTSQAISKRSFALAGAISGLMLLGLLLIWRAGLFELVESVANQTVVTKVASASAAKRISGDAHAISVLWQTLGLGAGWGSNRASSQLMRVISTVGLPGLAILCWFGSRLYTQHQRILADTRIDARLAGLTSASAWAVMGMLLAALVAAGDPNALGFWVGLGFYVGVLSARTPERGMLKFSPIAEPT